VVPDEYPRSGDAQDRVKSQGDYPAPSVAGEPDVISRIRHIFLQPRPHVSIMQAEGLLGWTRRQMSEAIEAGDVELWTTPLGKWFPRAEMMAKALEIWPMHVIEEALGDEADGILPQAIRSAELRVRLPRHHIDMLHYRADQQGDHRQRRAGAGAGRHRQRAHRGAVGGAAGVRRGDGLAGWGLVSCWVARSRGDLGRDSRDGVNSRLVD